MASVMVSMRSSTMITCGVAGGGCGALAEGEAELRFGQARSATASTR